MNTATHTHLVSGLPIKKTLKYFCLLFLAILLSSCSQSKEVFTVPFVAETNPVGTEGDAADDPWIDTKNQIIWGTDKRAGFYQYSLDGTELDFKAVGAVNNIDGRVTDEFYCVVNSNRTFHTLDYACLNLLLEEEYSGSLEAGMNVYGVCMGIINNKPVAILTEEEGVNIQYWDLLNEEIISTFDITADESNVSPAGNEAEGCVFDDEQKRIFISREGSNGILKAYDAETLGFIKAIDSRQGLINGDPEGIAIYKTNETEGFIIVSSQGDNTFNMYDRKAPFLYQGSFMIEGVEDTDGIDVTHLQIGDYPAGILVVQDGKNSPNNQNFKIVDMDEVLKKKALNPGSTK